MVARADAGGRDRAWLIDRSDVEIHDAAFVVLSMGFGALLFAGVLEDEDYFGIGGHLPGMLCALLGFARGPRVLRRRGGPVG